MNHPVRLEIIVALAGKRLTTKELADQLPEIPQATLYRQLNTLLEAGIIEVVSQRQTHGILESTYALKIGGGKISKEDFNRMSPEDHKGTHALLAGRSAKALARYVDQPSFDPDIDVMIYFAANLSLREDDAQELRQELRGLVEKYVARVDESADPRFLNISFIPEPKK